MNNINQILTCLLIIGSLLLISCKKPKKYSSIPDISFNNLSVKNSTDTLDNPTFKFSLSFNFVDGDGDLGLNPSDTFGATAPGEEYYYNLYIHLYEKTNGSFIQKDITYPYRYKNISKPSTNNPVIKGEMKVNFDLSQTDQYADTCYFEFYIFDRSLNQSNIEKTNEFYLYQ